ncbi:RagB/SusD family nutrient uptake outer membrane protein [Postechiella marina]|uniref:RagB/SusD family nutrient uptake outer membrane protein n=1 Tax=Postechiella marina TaxID=943941 RepID=A0ABP8CEY4_9FLAO
MKQLILKSKILFIVAIALMVGSCETLDEGSDGAIAAETFYSDEQTLTAGVVGLYGSLHRAVWSMEQIAHQTGADDITSRTTHSNKWVIWEADRFARTAGNSWRNNDWWRKYKCILACNSFIQNANPPGVDETIINDAKANAYFLRAYCYFTLATTFGDIPMPLVPEPDLQMSKTPKRQVLEQVISDYEYAITWAVNERDTNGGTVNNGRVSKTAAKALLAKTYMILTGYPYNETDKWSQVKTLTNEIIDAGVYSLMDDFAHNFQEPHQINKEVIWAHLMDRRTYTAYQNRSYGNRWGNWMDAYMEWTFFNNFPEGYRKTFTAIADNSNKYFIEHGNPIVTKFTWGTASGTNHPNAVDPVGQTFEHAWQTSNDRCVMRYSEVLLMNAEACANLGPISQAVDNLNLVRRRGYAHGLDKQADVGALPAEFWKTPDPSIDLVSSDKDVVIDAILAERGWEFVGETGGNRWLDLVRHEMVAEVTENRDPRELTLLGDPADKANWWSPIPDTEIVLNPILGD